MFTTMISENVLMLIFLLVSTFFLLVDLGVFSKNKQHMTVKRAVIWSLIWIGLAMLFNILVYFSKGEQAAMEFLAGYVIEKSLSVDNLFVFIMIFKYFDIQIDQQQKILKLGIIGAFVMRIIFIFAGVALIQQFHFMIYIFGGFLVLTGLKMLVGKEETFDPENNRLFKYVLKTIPYKHLPSTQHFFARVDKKLFATQLFICLLFIEISDLIFAVDSIPAILAVTQDRFIVLTSNLFAILGLRSLYFALSAMLDKFWLLGKSVAVILIFVGVKLAVSHFYKMDISHSLIVIGGILVAGIVSSLLISPPKAGNEA